MTGPRPLQLGFKVASPSTDWPTIEAIFARGGELDDVFASAWLNDHLELPGGPSWEGLTAMGALAHLVPRQDMGHLVLATVFRELAVLAKAAVVLDYATRGRFILGIGVGSYPAEFPIYGIPLAPLGDRLRRFESELRVLHALFGRSGPSPTWDSPLTIDDGPISIAGAAFDPPPFTPGGPRIWLGTQGEKVGLRLVAQYADGWNFSADGGFEAFERKVGVLREHCERVGRDPAEVMVSAQLVVEGDLGELLADCTRYVEAGCEHLVFYLDSRAGVAGLETLGERVARPLRDRFA